jgi:hypothetical protein
MPIAASISLPNTLPHLLLRMLLLASVSISLTVSAKENQNRQFIVLSDIHYEYDTNRETRDSTKALVVSALADAASRFEKTRPLFVLVLGDTLPHRGRNEGAADHICDLVPEFQRVFPNIPLFVTLGNNDAEVDNQVASKKLLQNFASCWLPLARQSQPIHAPDCYYASPLPGITNHKLLVLNSSFFDKKCRTPERQDLANEELRWLATEIQKARASAQSLWLAFHIAPGTSPHNSNGFWRTNEADAFLNLVAANSDVVKAIFCSHVHRDEFRVIYKGTDDPTNACCLVHISPSVSPNALNNPGYQLFSVDTGSGRLLDIQTFYLPMSEGHGSSKWVSGGSFTNDFASAGVTAFDLDSLKKLRAALKSDEKLQSTYAGNYSVHTPILTLELFDFSKYYKITAINVSGRPAPP